MDEFKYEVFKGIPKKNPLWLGSVSGLERATELMNRMADRLPGDYFVSSAITAEVVAAKQEKTDENTARREELNCGVAQVISRSSDEEPDMSHAYDLLKEDRHGERIWIETIIGLEHLKKRLVTLSSTAPGAYLIYDPTEAGFIQLFKKPA